MLSESGLGSRRRTGVGRPEQSQASKMLSERTEEIRILNLCERTEEIREFAETSSILCGSLL